MKQLISRLLGRRPPQNANPGEPPAPAGKNAARRQSGESLDPHSREDNANNSARRELLQVLFRDCVRKQGIPPEWLECQVMEVHSRSRGDGLQARLVIRHWDLRLLTYSYAFQQRLLSAISRFEPEASTWLHGVSWEFEVGNTCPYAEMPEDSLWRPKPAPAELPEPVPAPVASAPAAAGSDSDVLQDLERMFAIRDASIDTALDFQKTEPSKLS